MVVVLKLAIPSVLMAATCSVDITATCALVSPDISAVVVTAISAVDHALTVVVEALERLVIAVAMDNSCPPGKYQAVSAYRQQVEKL
jgi:hypothetical protein